MSTELTTMVSQTQIRDEINTQLIEALKSNTIVPWQQPWADVASVMPTCILTKLPFRDINPILLRIAAARSGYTSKWWGTERQWTIMGGKLLPEAKGVRIYHQAASELKDRVVHNLDVVSGSMFDKLRGTHDVKMFSEARDKQGNRLWKMESGRGLVNIEAERVIRATGADFREELRNGAFYYYPPLDYIVLPTMSQFYYGRGGPASYYATAFHELTHWTESRLGWLAEPGRSIKDRYAVGEMRADIGSAYLCAACGIPPQKDDINFDPRTNFCRYVKHWLRIMGEDNRFIFRVTKAASEAADYVLSLATGTA